MRAAAFGRPFLPPSFPPLLMREAARKLRVLNAARDPAVGVPLTMPQLDALTLPVLVSRWAWVGVAAVGGWVGGWAVGRGRGGMGERGRRWGSP
jgi:hypothetical protein